MRETYRCLDCGAPFLREPDATWKVRCMDCWRLSRRLHSAPVPAQAAAPVIEPQMLRRLLQLAHPDRHGGSEASVLATQYLLGLRDAARARG